MKQQSVDAEDDAATDERDDSAGGDETEPLVRSVLKSQRPTTAGASVHL